MLFVSSDHEEVVALADRALVMKEGRVVAEFQRSNLTEDDLIHAAHLGDPNLQNGQAAPKAFRKNFMFKNLHGRAADFIFAAPLTAAFIVMFAFFAFRGEGFFNADNLVNVALQSATLCIIAVALGLVMIAGYIDLSVGSVMGFAGVAAGYLMTQAHWSPVAASVAGVALAAVSGLINGVLVAYLGFSALIVTLGMLTILRGATFVITPQTFYDFGPASASSGLAIS